MVEEYSITSEPGPTNPTTKWTATDHLGSPRVITDSLGNVVSRRDFLPFGEELTNSIDERQPPNTDLKYNVADGVRQKFTGYQKDDETGLDFAEARMYENRHGRFTAVDPLLASGKSANPQTFNRYVYCLNNPLLLIDPDGLQAGFWTYYDQKLVNGGEGRNFMFFKNETELDTYNGANGTNFQEWKGPLYYIFEGRTAIRLSTVGQGHIFKITQMSDQDLQNAVNAQETGGGLNEAQIKALDGEWIDNWYLQSPEHNKNVMVSSIIGPGLAVAVERGLLSCAVGLPSYAGFTSTAKPRGPIFADTSLLVNAAEKGNIAALTEIRAGMTYVTPNQYREFLNVSTSAQRASRLSFLQNNGVTLFGGQQARAIAQTPIFQSTFRASLVQGRGDAALGAFSRATGFPAVTAERRLFNYYTTTCPKLGVPIFRIP